MLLLYNMQYFYWANIYLPPTTTSEDPKKINKKIISDDYSSNQVYQ